MGIDLGTTHSLVAIVRGDTPEVLPLELQGTESRLPSVVTLTPHPIVGKAAENYQDKGLPTFRSLKRLMGRSGEIQKAHLPTHIHAHADTALSPITFSTYILRELKARASTHVGYGISKAVITVPAYFDEPARQATRQAAEDAGIEVLRLISEPTAAALAYGLDQRLEGLWGVYDLGGGTFDFSLLRMHQGVFDVLGTGGSTTLGGDDIDALILENTLGKGWKTHITETKVQHLLLEARAVKETLTTSTTAKLSALGKQVNIRRTELENWVTPLIHQTLSYVTGVLQDTQTDTKDLQGVILVGGATRMPSVQKSVQQYFGQPPLCTLDPDHVVALGAAIQAEALTHGARHLLLDVTPLTLGLEVMGGIVEPLIHRNTRIPVRTEQTFTTAVSGQTTLKIHILQGESERVEACRSLGIFHLEGIPPLPAGEARVHVTFLIDTDGLLTVRAQEETTGKTQHVQIKPAYGLNPNALHALAEG
jgi:molecular chaperone HscA